MSKIVKQQVDDSDLWGAMLQNVPMIWHFGLKVQNNKKDDNDDDDANAWCMFNRRLMIGWCWYHWLIMKMKNDDNDGDNDDDDKNWKIEQLWAGRSSCVLVEGRWTWVNVARKTKWRS